MSINNSGKDDIFQHYLESPSHPTCHQCRVGFVDDWDFEQHCLRLHDLTRCKQCGRQYENVAELQQHYLTSIRHPTCPACEIGFETEKRQQAHIQTIHFHSDPVNGETDVQLSHVSRVPSPVYISQPSSPYRSVISRSVPIIENEDTLSTWTSCVFPDDEPPSVKPGLSNSGPSDITTPKAKWLRHSVEEVSTNEQSSLFSPVAISVTSTASGNGSSENDNVTSDDLRPYWTLNPPSPPAGALSSPEVQSPLELDPLPTISPTPSTPISLSTIAPARQVPWSQWGGSVGKAVSRPSLPRIATRLHKAPIESVKSSISTSLARDLVLLGFDKGNNSLLNTQAPDLSSPALMNDLSWKFNASMDLRPNGAHPETGNDQRYSVRPTYQKAQYN
ncbi:myc-associated zinc finger [Lentinula edodes]|uniref:Myc-associated zinc finger n=1 Tax=Lentinula edodes TaxID=5353 RepID=A0A1Q3DXC3_LENED|nr:myc-associated zinc finger [Lentinula edodes]